MSPSAAGSARSGTLPEPQVQAMFDRIAGVYDLMNSVMTAGLHHRWRERAADMAGPATGDHPPPGATGTGGPAIQPSGPVGPVRAGPGADFSAGVLQRARP